MTRSPGRLRIVFMVHPLLIHGGIGPGRRSPSHATGHLDRDGTRVPRPRRQASNGFAVCLCLSYQDLSDLPESMTNGPEVLFSGLSYRDPQRGGPRAMPTRSIREAIAPGILAALRVSMRRATLPPCALFVLETGLATCRDPETVESRRRVGSSRRPDFSLGETSGCWKSGAERNSVRLGQALLDSLRRAET